MIANIVPARRGLLQLVDMPGKGRGVVTTKAIPKDTLVEACPVIPMTRADRPGRRSVLSHYPFTWNDPPYIECFALGFVGLLNHSKTPNCRVESDPAEGVLRAFTIMDVAAGTELTWDYGVEPWFDVEP